MRDKKKTLDKNNEKLKFKIIAKKQKMQERGITLIALVVTIIILLILAGVTLNIALSDNGLFGKAKKAAEEYKEAQSDEEDLIRQFATQMYSEYVGAEVTGYTPIGKTVTVENVTENGEKQTFTTDTEMKWRVWDYDGNTLRIIGDPTGSLRIEGVAGYNNGVWALDHICKELYSNDKQGVVATNLKRTDIQKVSTYDYTKYNHEQSDLGDGRVIYFGESITYNKGNPKYPDMWNQKDKNWTYEYDNENKIATGRDKECRIWEEIDTEDGEMDNKLKEEENTKTFKQSVYIHGYNKNEFINDKYFDLIFRRANDNIAGNYWLACRCVYLAGEDCRFSLALVMNNYDGNEYMFYEPLYYSYR